jgi:hypothetical protein
MALAVKKFFEFRPHLPFRFEVEIFAGLDSLTMPLKYAVQSAKLSGTECDIGAGAVYFGNGYKTIPIFNVSSRTLTISFEETDQMRVLNFCDKLVASQRNGLPHVVGIRLTEYDTRFRHIVSDKYYKCIMKDYDEPAFSRTGGPGIVGMTVTFNVMSEQPWNANADHGVGKQEKTNLDDDAFINTMDVARDSQQTPSLIIDHNGLMKEFQEAFKAGKDAKRQEAQSSYGSDGNGGKYAPPGKQMPATGGIGQNGVTRENLKKLAKAEFTGTNGAGRKEGDANLVYLNDLDGGKQKGNFGMGNTQKYLEGLGVKNEKFTIIDTRTGQAYTGTMEELTNVMKEKGGASGAKSSWRLDDKSAARIEEISMGHVADQMQKNVDKDILAAMDAGTIGGLAHIEYGAGGALKTLGGYMSAHKEEVLAELKKNNGQLSDEFVNKMMGDQKVKSVLYKEWTVTEGKHAGERKAVDRRGRLTGKSGHSMRSLN